jgi:hypothetical protein
MTPEPLRSRSMNSLRASSGTVRSLADGDQESVISLIREFVRIPTRGGIDSCEPLIDCVSQWLAERDLPLVGFMIRLPVGL